MIKKHLEKSIIVWLSGFNKYILVQAPTDVLFEWFESGLSKDEILTKAKEELGLQADFSRNLIGQITLAYENFRKEKSLDGKKTPITNSEKKIYHHKRFYRISGKNFFFEYENKNLEFLIHPKFAHLEEEGLKTIDSHFQLFTENKLSKLVVNNYLICEWQDHEINYLAGNVSMQILQAIHAKEESNWMATFHAAGISNGKEGIMVLGDSGNGKSTLSAILMANGYQILADDFLPFDANTKKMCYFPAALSIKKGSYTTVSENFPEIGQASEYHYPSMGKIVKYLSNNSYQTNPPGDVPCKALIFVQYDKNTVLEFKSLKKEQAFQKLVPDSWISPEQKNAQVFLQWFSELPCYQLTYSDNTKMLHVLNQLFNE